MNHLIRLALLFTVFNLFFGGQFVFAAGVTISDSIPGGNVIVTSNIGNEVSIKPDLRDGRSWFYWCFEATATSPGDVIFTLPGKNSKIQLGMQGPAVSYDQGTTWTWMGTDNVNVAAGTFTVNFTAIGQKIRLAVSIPYTQKNYDIMLARNAGNPHLTTSTLTTSPKGRPIELLQIGEEGPDKEVVILTARHHASESMASFVLEGFLEEAMSNSAEAISFREKYVVFAVPFVDKDGVEDGDQGKNRNPHDHNRDYGDYSIYPSVQAIMALGEAKRATYLVDWHCPTLRVAEHQGYTLWGLKTTTDLNNNVNKWAANMRAEAPANTPAGFSNWLGNISDPTICSNHFALQKRMVMALTIEVPYAPAGKNMLPLSCNLQGKAMLKAWTKTSFVAPVNSLLSIHNGTGTGTFATGEEIPITAAPAPAGQVFDQWLGDQSALSNIYDPTTVVTMPAAPVTLTATYKFPGPLSELSVANGSGSGRYSIYRVVDIVANEIPGQFFIKWTGDTMNIENIHDPSTSITMPNQDVSIAASYWSSDPSLLAWWSFEETSGTTLGDRSGKHDLVLSGGDMATSTTTGKSGKGLLLDGTNQNHANHPRLLDIMPSEMTFAGWVKPDATGMSSAQTFLAKTNNAARDQMFAQFQMSGPETPGQIVFIYRNYGPGMTTLKSGITWTDDTWYHYAASWGAEGLKLYINGSLVANNADSTLFANGESDDFSLGNAGGSAQYFKGAIDEIQIYGKSLSGEEIQNLYNSRYTLTVERGRGDGLYAAGEVVTITADSAPAGKIFDTWTGTDLADIQNATTTVTLSNQAKTIAATYKNDSGIAKGDIDNNGEINLVDCILALQIVTGTQPSTTIHVESDTDNDQKIGMTDLIYILQTVATTQ